VSLDDKDDLLARVLIDLQQSWTYEGSVRLADHALRNLEKVNRLHKRGIEKAGFMVLKAPDIPSVLVETAFISNPTEERKLTDRRFQQRLVDALHAAIRAWFRDSPPPGTLFALREHTIRSGDTLSEIAARYNVSLDNLKVANNLHTDMVRVGQILQIP
jgi:N-acetylmuramoyl-L-alanine amidase